MLFYFQLNPFAEILDCDKLDKIQVVNAIADESGFIADESDFKALVVARPEHIADSELTILDLPPALQADVARQK